jgi:cytochrome c oxidase assembly protein subunit 15
VGASQHIEAAQAAIPNGPVTPTKAWIEMIHRYLAMTVGLLILITAIVAWWDRKTLPYSPLWPSVTLGWVIVQGLFGKYTVTLKLYPAVVTAHLLGGLVLLALLVRQHVAWKREKDDHFGLPKTLRGWLAACMAVLWLQIALGGWVSTNYAVLACTGFPQCNEQWWPEMDFGSGFTLLRELGMTGSGELLPMQALVAIHMTHRGFAAVLTVMVVVLGWKLWRLGGEEGQRWGALLWALLLWQLASGLSNVVLGWPLAAALGHSAGAAGLVMVSSWLWFSSKRAPRAH